MDKTVDAYFDWRGLKGFDPAPACIRFDPKGEHWSRDKNGAPFNQYFPMLFVQATDPKTGEMTGGQRIYLAYRGRGFAPVEKKFRKNYRDASDLWGYPALRQRPLTTAMIVICVIVFLMQNFPSYRPLTARLYFSSFTRDAQGESGARPRGLIVTLWSGSVPGVSQATRA